MPKKHECLCRKIQCIFTAGIIKIKQVAESPISVDENKG